MEDRYQHTVAGQEVRSADINFIATEAALADDHVFSELLRLGSGAKVVTASGSTSNSAILRPSGNADAKVSISTFRAFIGPISPASAMARHKEVRSAVMANAVSTATTQVQFAAATNNRWDLVYARVDVEIDGASVSRYVKTGTDPVGVSALVLTKKSTVTIVVLAGGEATTPTKPVLPLDSDSAYYIPLGFVLLPAGHTLTTAIAPQNIDETAPVTRLTHAVGVVSLSVANGSYLDTGPAMTNETWTPALGRPSGYLPPTMTGGRSVFFPLHFATSGHDTIATTGVIDDSIDWRYRYFKFTVACGSNAAGNNYSMAHKSGGTVKIPNPINSALGSPNTKLPTWTDMAQSFAANTSAGPLGDRAQLMELSPDVQFPLASKGMQTSSRLEIYVDLSNGKLMGSVSNTSPQCEFLIWLEATGQFNNCFTPPP